MMDNKKSTSIIEQAIEVLQIEANGILSLAERIDDRFIEMVELICSAKGRLIVSGIGKSGTVGQKIVGTLNSTGTRALFLHPVEAMHGDLGMVSQDDILLALSNSGETVELNMLIPNIKNIGCKVIGFTGNLQSTLAANSDIVIDVGVEKEACPMGLVPTASTTALLAMGDALAITLINKNRFKSSDFLKVHPSGYLGHRLACNVGSLMLKGEDVPCVGEGTGMEEAVAEINRLQLGVTLVTENSKNALVGIITDGDIRRLIAEKQPIFDLKVEDVMSKNPHSLGLESPAYDALNIMEHHQITVLPITNAKKIILGILHLHDILGKGEFKFNGT
jgi:arabinose-5-phosphate isomerase